MFRTKKLALLVACLALAGAWLVAQTPAPPPDLTGTWSGQTQMSRGKDLFTLVLARKAESYSGTMSDAMGLLNQAPLLDVKYSDGTLRFSFKASLPNRDLQLEATLRLENGRLVGLWTAETGDTSSLDLERRGSVAPVAALPAALPQVKYTSEPDTRYMYAHVGYAVLGAALGRVARQPYVDYVRERILVPLGMTHGGFELDAEMRARLAKGYEVDEGKVGSSTSARELAGRGYKVPNGGLFTTVGDMARFVSFELGEGPETVLGRTTWAANLTRTNEPVTPEPILSYDPVPEYLVASEKGHGHVPSSLVVARAAGIPDRRCSRCPAVCPGLGPVERAEP